MSTSTGSSSESNYNPLKYVIVTGRVQGYVCRPGNKEVPMFIQHFGLPQYDTRQPVIPDYLRKEVQEIVDKLNAGSISEAEAVELLKEV